MKDFTRGLLVGLLAGVGFTCIVATAADAPPEPKDLVGFATNDLNKPMFLTTWPASPPLLYKVKCEGHWHFAVSMRPKSEKNPEGDLFGCYTFTAPQEITIVWNDKGHPVKVLYKASEFEFTDWFLKLYPIHGPDQAQDEPDTEPETGQPDIKL